MQVRSPSIIAKRFPFFVSDQERAKTERMNPYGQSLQKIFVLVCKGAQFWNPLSNVIPNELLFPQKKKKKNGASVNV